MPEPYAEDFGQIPATLAANANLAEAVARLARTEPMPGKATEGEGRLEAFRAVLTKLIEGTITLEEAYARTEGDVPRSGSPHASNNRVFPQDWGERLIRTQLSSCYNQAVLEELLAAGEKQCHVPHSKVEAADSKCSRELAGANHDCKTLYNRLVRSYREDIWSRDVMVPNHPHCTHTVVPAR